MSRYTRDFPIDRPETWHDEAAQQDALDALEAGDFEELKRVFHEARGISLDGILRDIIKARL